MFGSEDAKRNQDMHQELGFFSIVGKRDELNYLYTTKEDFARADRTCKRMVIIGNSGAGKSTLLNIMGGWRFEQQPDDEFLWRHGTEASPLFKADVGAAGCTQKSAFANLHYLGCRHRAFIAVDTPGFDDPDTANIEEDESRERLGMLAADLHDKLQALGSVHLIVVLHNDVRGGRMSPPTYKMLQMLEQKFAKANHSIWENTVMAFCKCNEYERGWKNQLERKKRELQERIKRTTDLHCPKDVPVICLGGGVESVPSRNHGGDRQRSRSPRRSHSGGSLREKDIGPGFEDLWTLLEAASPIDTSNLQPFEGDDVKWKAIIDERDLAVAREKASRVYTFVCLKLFFVFAFLFWRQYLLPGWVSAFFLLNLNGPIDEVMCVALVVWWIGPSDVYYSCEYVWNCWLRPKFLKTNAKRD